MVNKPFTSPWFRAAIVVYVVQLGAHILALNFQQASLEPSPSRAAYEESLKTHVIFTAAQFSWSIFSLESLSLLGFLLFWGLLPVGVLDELWNLFTLTAAEKEDWLEDLQECGLVTVIARPRRLPNYKINWDQEARVAARGAYAARSFAGDPA